MPIFIGLLLLIGTLIGGDIVLSHLNFPIPTPTPFVYPTSIPTDTPTPTPVQTNNNAAMTIAVQNCLNQSYLVVNNEITQMAAIGTPNTADQDKMLFEIAYKNCQPPAN